MERNMIQTIKLQTNRLPKQIADLIHSNQFLKIFSFASMALLILAFVTIIILATKAPAVIAFDTSGNNIENLPKPNPKHMVEHAIRQYIKLRYEWTPKTVSTQLKTAKAFIANKSDNAYSQATSKVEEFSVSRKASQRAFPTEIKIDLKNQVAKISGERVTSIMGVRAAGELKLELHFSGGPHTTTNPWGVYIVREVELL